MIDAYNKFPMPHIPTYTFNGHKLPVAGTPDAPEFEAKTVCNILGWHKYREGLRAHVDPEDIIEYDPVDFINESGLFALIHASAPESQRFKHWVTGELLPSIRKHTRYSIKDQAPALTAAMKKYKALLIECGVRGQVQIQSAAALVEEELGINPLRMLGLPTGDEPASPLEPGPFERRAQKALDYLAKHGPQSRRTLATKCSPHKPGDSKIFGSILNRLLEDGKIIKATKDKKVVYSLGV